jgi:hypothetical protein
MENRFGIRSRFVAMASRFEPLTNRPVVVDLAVEDDPRRIGLVGNRLMSGGQIDDAQAAMSERRMRIREQAGIVRASVRDDVAHTHDPLANIRMELFGRDDTRDPAHVR